jgi:hypothetical protein
LPEQASARRWRRGGDVASGFAGVLRRARRLDYFRHDAISALPMVGSVRVSGMSVLGLVGSATSTVAYLDLETACLRV